MDIDDGCPAEPTARRLDTAGFQMGLVILINGVPMGGLIHASVTTSNYFSSDSFSITFAVDATVPGEFSAWSELTDADVAVEYVDVGAPFSTTIIVGTVDLLIADPVLRTISVEGRDLSASLIDSYLQQDFVNQTASEIVATIASQYGLASKVTPTSVNVGRYFGDGYTKLSLGQFSTLRSNWDLVVQLAREANFDIFMQGRTLVFQPVVSDLDPPVLIIPSNVTAMRLERSLSIKSSAKVKVQSWNSQKMASYSATATDPDGNSSQDSSQTNLQTYLFSKSNLTPVQADLSAERYRSEVTRLRTVLHLDMPWDFRVSARSLVLLQGTESSFDGLYQVDCLDRRYSSISGSIQTARAVSWPV